MRQQATTVFERSKKNGGYIAGPNHTTLRRRMEDAATADDEPATEGGNKPPNLRSAKSSTESCGSCEHYAARKCKLHDDCPVIVSDLCDDFDREDTPQNSAEESGTRMAAGPSEERMDF
jgi:hypothetical protein